MVYSGPWFQWHYDRWTLPPSATEIARNERASQAFVLRRNLAVQFHPEMTPEILDGWLATGGRKDVQTLGLDSVAVQERTRELDVSNRERAH